MLTIAVVGVCAAQADSDSRVVEVWSCSLNEGKTQEDVQTANKKWVKLQNDNVEGGDIRSFVLTTIVGKTETFNYADSFPSMEAWMASKEVMKSEAGQALEKELNAVAKCSSNTLHESNES
jgi:hypothetical protein